MNHFERVAFQHGYRWIAGVDEAGRGPLAGPVVAAAVVLPPDYQNSEINDSKKLSLKNGKNFMMRSSRMPYPAVWASLRLPL